MKRQPLFVTSDWHCGHANSIIFDKRPFTDLDHMHRTLINNFNSSVPTNGITYFAGDMGFGSLALAQIISQLNGTKILIMGNHDKGSQAMYDMGFNVVMNGAKLIIANELVTISHYPLLGIRREPTDHIKGHEHENWYGENKHSKVAFKDEGQFNLHGHTHCGPANPLKFVALGRQLDVGVMGNSYRPWSVSNIESWIARTKQAEILAINNGTR